MPSTDSIKTFWNEAAQKNPYWYVSSYSSYDADRNMEEFWGSGKMIWSALKQAAGYVPDHRHTVVEIGCGVGRLTRAIAPEVERVISFDISEKMLAIARQAELTNVDFRLAEGFALSVVPDRSVDLALAYCVFQHLPTTAALRSYLIEMQRVTKPGGIMAFTIVPRDWAAWVMPALRAKAYLRERLLHRGPKGTYRKEWVGIRPAPSVISRIAPLPLQHCVLPGEQVLYFGRPAE